MKKNILALAVASAIAAPVAMADEGTKGPDVYGQINAAINSTSDMGMKTTDRDSRLGVKGSQDLGNGLKGVYKMEFGVSVADSFDSLSGRNAFVGLAGGFGTVMVGRHDTPFKMSQPKDLFGDATYGDMGKTAIAGKLGVNGKAGEIRADNVVAYMSPEFNGVQFMVAGVSNIAQDVTGTADNESETDSALTNAISASVTYGSSKKGIYLAAAMNTWDGATDKDTDQKAATEMRISAQYAEAGLIANVVYQSFDETNNIIGKTGTDGTNIQVNLGYKMGNLMPKFKYSMVDYDKKHTTKEDGSAMGIGVDYKLAKKTTAYVEYISSGKELGANGDKDLTDISFGVKHKF